MRRKQRTTCIACMPQVPPYNPACGTCRRHPGAHTAGAGSGPPPPASCSTAHLRAAAQPRQQPAPDHTAPAAVLHHCDHPAAGVAWPLHKVVACQLWRRWPGLAWPGLLLLGRHSGTTDCRSAARRRPAAARMRDATPARRPAAQRPGGSAVQRSGGLQAPR